MLTPVLNPLYENLKKEIKQYEINEQLSFDETLQELRKDKKIIFILFLVQINILDLYLDLITVEILWLQSISIMIK